MLKRLLTAAVPLLLLAGSTVAQEDEVSDREQEVEQKATEDRAPARRETQKERILRAIRLPRSAEDAREAGVPEEDVRGVLNKAKEKEVPAADIHDILDEEARTAREQGPTDNFGAFVQSRLDQGLRGRDLAAAIHAEKAALKGRPEGAQGKGQSKGKAGKAKDKTEDKGSSKGKGKSGKDRAGKGGLS